MSIVLSMSFSWFKVGIGAFANKSLLLSKTNKNEKKKHNQIVWATKNGVLPLKRISILKTGKKIDRCQYYSKYLIIIK